jgi:hypothetical protein
MAPHGDGFVVDNILCFLNNKIDILPTDTIVKLCVGTYTEEEIKKSKELLFELCADDTTTRLKKRQGEKKNEQNIEDMLLLLHEKGDDVPTFVVKDLSRLPPITFDSIDVCVLLAKLEKTVADVKLLKKTIQDQTETAEGLTLGLAAATEKITRAERHTAASLNDGIASDLPIDITDSDLTAVKGATNVMSYSAMVRRQQQQPPIRAIQPVQPRKPRGITGKDKTAALKPAAKQKRLANVFASRFDPEVTEDQVQTYLQDKLKHAMEVIKVKTRYDTYASFHIKCYCEQPEDFMKEDVWPEDIYVRWWREERKGKNERPERGHLSVRGDGPQ